LGKGVLKNKLEKTGEGEKTVKRQQCENLQAYSEGGGFAGKKKGMGGGGGGYMVRSL